MKPGAAAKAGLKASLPTVIFIHGFSEISPGSSGKTIVDGKSQTISQMMASVLPHPQSVLEAIICSVQMKLILNIFFYFSPSLSQ